MAAAAITLDQGALPDAAAVRALLQVHGLPILSTPHPGQQLKVKPVALAYAHADDNSVAKAAEADGCPAVCAVRGRGAAADGLSSQRCRARRPGGRRALLPGPHDGAHPLLCSSHVVPEQLAKRRECRLHAYLNHHQEKGRESAKRQQLALCQ
jgi:hypothetical protein